MEKEFSSEYKLAKLKCWKCGKITKVYHWKKDGEWSQQRPPDPIPESVKYKYSKMIEDSYWANTCEYCGVIQGDWFFIRN